MAVKARAAITVSIERDVLGTWRFYRIASSTSAPSAPTVDQGKAYISSGTVPSGWSKVEPAYDGVSTNSLYFADLTGFSDGDAAWTDVSKSSSYEAAKQAYNKAQNAEDTAGEAWNMADEAQDQITDLDERASEALDDTNARIDGLDIDISGIQADMQTLATQTALADMDAFVSRYLGDSGAMRIVDQGLDIKQGEFSVLITGDRIVFMQSGQSVAYLTNQKLYISKTEVLQQQMMGNFAWVIRSGRLTLMKVR